MRTLHNRLRKRKEIIVGCDIHTYREKQVAGQWVSADVWEESEYADEKGVFRVPYERQAYTGRNYDLFGALAAGVRREFDFAFKPRGVPFDVSDNVSKANKQWDSDGHSHSYLYLHELRDFASWLKTQTVPIEGMKNAEQLAALKESIASGNPDWNKLYPYCQWTSELSAVKFCIDVPASFAIGKCLDEIIASFDGIDGDNHRLVFWFDN